MNSLKRIREAMGISQAEMGGLLRMKKSTLSMIEIGKRQLPNNAVVFLAWMQDELEAWSIAIEPIVPPEGAVQKEIRKLEARLENLSLELENRHEKEKQAGFLQFICEAFASRFPEQIPALAKYNIAVLLAVEDLRKDKELANAPIFLQAKIKGMEARIAFLRANM